MTKCDGETTLGTNNQNCRIPSLPDPNAFGTSSPEEGVRDQVQDRPSRRSTAPDSLTERDELVISHVARYRLLSYSQVHQFLLSSVDISFARRTIRRLARAGWLTTWEPGTTTGGHARYALPTSRALRHPLSSLPTDPWAPVVQLMLPATRRRSLELADGALPKWLPHQREVNQLAIGLEHSRRSNVRWMSTWDSPFPPRIGMFRSPQPDYVMVGDVDGASPLLVFGEHDRASEPVERFVARKIAPYAALLKFPEARLKYFGVRELQIQISVTDPYRRRPMERIRTLIDATRRYGGVDGFRFTLAGWVFAYPTGRIWFTTTNRPVSDSLSLSDHPETVS